MSDQVCVISGVGPGTGSALAKRFADGGYRVALLARSESRLTSLKQELAGAKGYPCDVSDPGQVEHAGPPSSATSAGRASLSTMRSAAPSAHSAKSIPRP
jgi:NADP-dependent 3-hydroxy acid dehydrogenase YdfG